MNVLLVAEYYSANPDFMELSNELTSRKHSVSVATSFRDFDKGKIEKGDDIFEITPFVTINSIPHSLSFPLSRIRRIVKERDIEIIHALMDYSTNTAAASVVSKVTNVPFVCTVQGVGTRTGRFVVDALAECYDWTIERLISRNAKKLILLSGSLISRTRKLGVPDSKAVVIPSGIDCTRFDPRRPEIARKSTELRSALGIDQNDIVVGFVGRLVPAKGLLDLLAAVTQIKTEFPNIVLLVVGDGPQRAELQLRAKDLSLKTVFAGYQFDTPPYYALMDVFALPSFFEGLPGVVLEAMAMEKAVVATSVGGNRDVVIEGRNGFLVPPRDIQRLASALRKLIADECLRNTMGGAGRALVQKNFLWDDIAGKVEKVYEEATRYSGGALMQQ